MALVSFLKGVVVGVLAEKNKSAIKETVRQVISSPEAQEVGKRALVQGGKVALSVIKNVKKVV